MNCIHQARRCGGCNKLHMPYEKQLTLKQERVHKTFKKTCKIIGMDDPFRYRNKVISAFAWQNGLISGMYAYGTHFVLPVNDCLLEIARADEIVAAVRTVLEKLCVKPYDEVKKTGLARFVQVRYAKKTEQALVTLVLAKEEMPSPQFFVKKLIEICPDVRSVVLNVNDRAGSAVLGFREKVLYGDGYIEDILCGKTLRIASRSFYQVNSVQAEKLYSVAIGAAQLKKHHVVADVYCGIGAIGLLLAPQVKSVVGIELNADAVRLAKENAAINHIGNITFVRGDAGEKLARLENKPDVVFLDPPRAGCDEKLLKTLKKIAPEKIVYISCNITTQKRDIEPFVLDGYQVAMVQPVDMFPHTDHVETVVMLSHKKEKPQ